MKILFGRIRSFFNIFKQRMLFRSHPRSGKRPIRDLEGLKAQFRDLNEALKDDLRPHVMERILNLLPECQAVSFSEDGRNELCRILSPGIEMEYQRELGNLGIHRTSYITAVDILKWFMEIEETPENGLLVLTYNLTYEGDPAGPLWETSDIDHFITLAEKYITGREEFESYLRILLFFIQNKIIPEHADYHNDECVEEFREYGIKLQERIDSFAKKSKFKKSTAVRWPWRRP